MKKSNILIRLYCSKCIHYTPLEHGEVGDCAKKGIIVSGKMNPDWPNEKGENCVEKEYFEARNE